MTGLERLRELVDGMGEWSVFAVMNREWCERHGVTVIEGRMAMKDLLSEIADQIERETAHDPSKDVSMSAYDLLPDCDREAISLALDCGGAEEIKKRLMPEGMEWPRYEDGEPVRLGEHWEEDGFDESVTRIDSIEFADDGVRFENEYNEVFCRYNERVKRPAPKVLDADGVEIRVGDTVYLLPGEWCDRFPLLRCHEWDAMKVLDLSPNHTTGRIECATSPGSVVCFPYPSQLTHERPVLDAEGNRIEPAMDVWWVCEGDERGIHAEKLHVESIGEDGFVECSPFNSGTWVELDSTELYVHKPVLDADGVPIREGDVLYSIETGDSVTVGSIEPGNPWFATTDGTLQHCAKLTHRAPVLAADGRPLREGETVWGVDSGTRYTVEKITDELIPIKCRSEMGSTASLYPSQLTHERPDSWEKYEEKLCYLLDDGDLASEMTERAKALAERGER